jgi:tetratricopeptide (TPR) repeat protein
VVFFFLPLAVVALALLLILRPADAPYLDALRRGDVLAEERERSAAVAAYAEAARLRPEAVEPHLRTGRVYLAWGRLERAALSAAQAQRHLAGADDPTQAARLERLWIEVYAAQGDWPAVIEHARRLLALEPADWYAHQLLAHAHLKRLDWDAATAVYAGLVDAYPDDALAHERLGLLGLGRDPAAPAHLARADTPLARAALEAAGVEGREPLGLRVGRALFEAQEWALAAHHLERALDEAPDRALAHAYRGHALDQLERPREAWSHLRRARELAPDSAPVHTFVGLHHERQGDLTAARAAYETAYDLDPQNPALCVEIGQTWAAERRYVAAEIWLRAAVDLRPEDPRLWETLARFYLDHGIDVGGRGFEAAERAVALAPGSARAHDLLSWAALQRGAYGLAEEHLTRALALDEDLAAAHYHLGLLWRAQGEDASAREAFQRALDLDTSATLETAIERAWPD